MQIYKDGWRENWLSGSQGTKVDQSTVVVRTGTSITLSAISGPFNEFSMVTTVPFSVDSIVDMWIQGTAVQNAVVYLRSSSGNVQSKAVHLSSISPESIAASEVFEGSYRLVGPDAEDWFRLSINAKSLIPDGDSVTDTWDAIVFRDASGTGSSVYVSSAQILPNMASCEARSELGCIGNVCNSLIGEVFAQSNAVPLFGFGPIQEEAANMVSAAGVEGISLIAKLANGTTYAQVAAMCARLQGLAGEADPGAIFARSSAMMQTRSASPNVVAVCQIEPAVGPLAVEQASAPVEWPLLTVVSYSFDNISTMRSMVVDEVSYFDKDGTAYASQVEASDILQSSNANCPGLPWGLSRIDQPSLPLDNVFEPGLTGSGVHIYVLDTGLNSHSDFDGRVVSGVACYTGSCSSTSYADGTGHGTHVASTAAGRCYGVAKRAMIHPVKVLGDNGMGSYSGIINGIKWAVEDSKRRGVRGVINMSLGGGASASLNAAVEEAVNRGVVVAVAAGNENAADACTKSPASARSAITVGSTTKYDTMSSFSNVGSCLDIFAPGSRIAAASYQNYNSYRFLSGTSMATPHVAGAAALYLEKHPTASPAAVTQGLLNASVQRNLYPGTTTSLLQAYASRF